jgi:hypothetical protein
MEPVAGSNVVLHGDSWFASLTLHTLKAMDNMSVELIKTDHSNIPMKWLRLGYGGLSTLQDKNCASRVWVKQAKRSRMSRVGRPEKHRRRRQNCYLLQCSCWSVGQAANVFGRWRHCTSRPDSCNSEPRKLIKQFVQTILNISL